ncbi:MAG: 2-oxoglutarate dehydrogenase complex dihydrolipoyllysine-residue succinyltransferase [Pirellulales bacterium]
MAIELKVPEVGESITEVMIGVWKKNVGDSVSADESVVEIESDKATVELPAPSNGVVSAILKQAGEQAVVGEVIGYLEAVASSQSTPAATPEPSASSQVQSVDVRHRVGSTVIGSVQPASGTGPVMPAAARVLGEAGVPPQSVSGSGPGQRVTKADATSAVSAPPSSAITGVIGEPQPVMTGTTAISSSETSRGERPVLMSPMRRRIAERLVEAQHQAALLTTFNEVDMTAVMELRKKFKDNFVDRHGVKLGFMSFFVRAAVEALHAVPQVNAEFRDPHIVYRDFCDIGIAVGGGKGLVVPILRNAERMNFAQIEQSIGDFAHRAADNKVKLEELQGGTFTISNGGVYGSMLSTPIINPPQSGILGLHAIQERPVAVNGEVVVRPMMYVALSYDHRIVDGREAVTFLKRIKEMIEDPTRLMLEC